MASQAMEQEAPAPPPQAAEPTARRKTMTDLARMSLAVSAVDNPDVTKQVMEVASMIEGTEDGGSKISAQEAVANFVISCVGAGIVVFPKLVSETGPLAAMVILMGASVVCYECALMIISCCSLVEAIKGKAPGTVVSYEEVAEAALGKPGKTMLATTKNFYQLGCILALSVLIADCLTLWIPLNPHIIRWCIAAPLYLVIGMIKELKQLARVLPMGTVAVFIQVLSICIGSVYAAFGEKQEGPPREPMSIMIVGSALSIFVFGFDAIVALPTIRGQMADPSELPAATFKGFCIVAGLCCGVMMAGYAGYGNAVEDNVIDSMGLILGEHHCYRLSCILGSISSLALLLNLLISVPLLVFCIMSFFESTKTREDDLLRTPMTWPNIAFRACMMLLLILVGSLLPFAKQLINLVSSIFGSCNSLFFPVAFFYSLRKKANPSALEPIPMWRYALQAGVVVTGIVACVFGSIGGLEELQAKLAELSNGTETTTTTVTTTVAAAKAAADGVVAFWG